MPPRPLLAGAPTAASAAAPPGGIPSPSPAAGARVLLSRARRVMRARAWAPFAASASSVAHAASRADVGRFAPAGAQATSWAELAAAGGGGVFAAALFGHHGSCLWTALHLLTRAPPFGGRRPVLRAALVLTGRSGGGAHGHHASQPLAVRATLAVSLPSAAALARGDARGDALAMVLRHVAMFRGPAGPLSPLPAAFPPPPPPTAHAGFCGAVGCGAHRTSAGAAAAAAVADAFTLARL